jgi:hypothetical protein
MAALSHSGQRMIVRAVWFASFGPFRPARTSSVSPNISLEGKMK